MLVSLFTNSAPSVIVVFPVPLIPFSNIVVLASSIDFIVTTPLFDISTSALLPLNVTLDNSTFPEFIITADPLLFLNVTLDTLRVPFSVPFFPKK